MTEITRIAIDTSKAVFTLHGVDDATVPAAAKQAIALLGREADRIEMRPRAIDAELMQQHKSLPLA